jgi:hypothetical protein
MRNVPSSHYSRNTAYALLCTPRQYYDAGSVRTDSDIVPRHIPPREKPVDYSEVAKPYDLKEAIHEFDYLDILERTRQVHLKYKSKLLNMSVPL